MSKKEISVFSLSLLDLLFCAFGGVIVLTVVFSAIIKYEQAQTEKSPQAAFTINVEYTKANIFPSTWKAELRIDPPGQSRTRYIRDGLNVFENRDFVYIREMDNISRGSFQMGFEGNLRFLESEVSVQDTLHISLYEDSDFPLMNSWNNRSGEVLISATIYRAGELPKLVELPAINANRLYNFQQSIPIVIKLQNKELSLSILP